MLKRLPKDEADRDVVVQWCKIKIYTNYPQKTLAHIP